MQQFSIINTSFIKAPIGIFLALMMTTSTAIVTFLLSNVYFRLNKEISNFELKNLTNDKESVIILVTTSTWLTSTIIYLTGFLSLINHRRNGSSRLAFYSLTNAAILVSCGFFYSEDVSGMFGEYDQVIGQIVHLLIWVDSFLFFSYWGYFMTYGYDHGNRPTLHYFKIENEKVVKRWRDNDDDEKMLIPGGKIDKKPDMHYVLMLAQEIRDSKRTISHNHVNHVAKNEDFQVEIYKVC